MPVNKLWIQEKISFFEKNYGFSFKYDQFKCCGTSNEQLEFYNSGNQKDKSQKTGLGITGILSELMGLKSGEVMGVLSAGMERERDRKEEEDKREEWRVGEREGGEVEHTRLLRA